MLYRTSTAVIFRVKSQIQIHGVTMDRYGRGRGQRSRFIVIYCLVFIIMERHDKSKEGKHWPKGDLHAQIPSIIVFFWLVSLLYIWPTSNCDNSFSPIVFKVSPDVTLMSKPQKGQELQPKEPQNMTNQFSTKALNCNWINEGVPAHNININDES